MQRSPESNSSTMRVFLIVLAIVGSILLVLTLVCGGALFLIYRGATQVIAKLQEPSPGLELQNEDYAEARRQFKTRLLVQGPAPQAPNRPLRRQADVTTIEFPSGKLRLKAWINAPKKEDQSKRPAVLFLHGGFAFDQEDWDMCQPFRDAGFVTLAPILRGENGQGGSFTLFYDEVEDVLAAAEYLSKLPYVDAKRIYVAGHHAGGTLTLLAAMASKHFRAAASLSAPPDLTQFVKSQPVLIPFDEANVQEFQLRSPVAYATSFKCPVRMYYGNLEDLGGSTQRTAMLAKENNLEVEAIQVTGDQMTAVDPAIKQAIEFFKQK